ncbi:hypothetical protein C483_02775 [Natrialba hulunbeirensis JCM 10989]|uniref:PGF-CTERM archaeal protein-sorting signal domain-containing protein n=1 Tax=Natrialba hulunbeirensis JCM 10989 TaxID=1227493 RepID=M0A791_9EURY|nr:PGF-CTERM sorting domain-containing protein [Natrialba hulunbeirensis]ELY94620.1 hypothetical protein C483_02775 [Natrialba hulunbeirensis JCM 10989]
MAVVLITSAVAGTAVAGSETGIDQADPADEVFVTDDGDAVLVYEDDADDDLDGSAEFGLDASESVVYALISDDIEEDITAAFSFALGEDGMESDGSFVADRPDAINDFSMNVDGEQTEETNELDADLELVLDTQEFPEADFVQSATSSGEMVSSADEFAMEGDLSVSHIMPAEGPETGLDLTITETDGSYTVDVSQQDTLQPFEVDQWETEADAKAALEAEYGAIAQELGGDATVTIHDHEFDADTAGGGYIDVEYTIELENVKDGLEQLIADELTNDPELDISQSDAEEVAADILAAELEAFEFSYAFGENTVDAEWDIAFSNFETTAMAVLDLVDAVDEMDEEFDDEFDDYAEMYEAQVEADLTQTSTWDLRYEGTGANEATLTFDYDSDAENWDAYTDELAERDIDSPEFVIDATATTDDDEVSVEMALEFTQEDYLETAINAMVQDLQNDPMMDDEALALVTAFEEAELELAKFDLDMDDGTVTMEAGATFDDISAFESHLSDAYHGLTVEHIYADSDDEAAYVYATGMVDADATEDDVREHAIVDDATTVHMPGEWDEEHPRLDMGQVTEFLGTDATDSETESDDDGLPGFGAVAALVAMLSALGLARWHN